MKLWQLVNPQTNEKLSGLQKLPENWGPIFGLEGVKDRLGDLSWLGITDRAWVEVEVPDFSDPKTVIDGQIAHCIKECEAILVKENITKGEFAAWNEYRRLLEEIVLQVEYPENIYWPARPE